MGLNQSFISKYLNIQLIRYDIIIKLITSNQSFASKYPCIQLIWDKIRWKPTGNRNKLGYFEVKFWFDPISINLMLSRSTWTLGYFEVKLWFDPISFNLILPWSTWTLGYFEVKFWFDPTSFYLILSSIITISLYHTYET
jgi:hypothetical protein